MCLHQSVHLGIIPAKHTTNLCHERNRGICQQVKTIPKVKPGGPQSLNCQFATAKEIKAKPDTCSESSSALDALLVVDSLGIWFLLFLCMWHTQILEVLF